MVEEVSQGGIGAKLGGLDGGEGHAERLGNLGAGELGKPEFDDLPLRFGKLRECLSNLTSGISGDGVLFGRTGGIDEGG